ncbi:hypothetical protein Q5752_001201 [Cryptotrichosporon argae]
MTASQLKHVLIVGAGLGGPCLALALARSRIRSTLLELRPSRPTSGGSISLGPPALHVLDKYAGVYDSIKEIGYSYYRFGAYTEDGEKLGEIVVGEEGKEGGYPAIRIMRPELNRLLLEACERTGLVDIKWGVKLQKIDELDNQVKATLEDGAELSGDILVGADGIHSQVRKHVLGDAAPQAIFDGVMIVNGFVPASSIKPPSRDFSFPAFMFTPSGMFMTIPIDKAGATLAWGINRETGERPRAEWAALERSGEAARLAKADYAGVPHEPVRSILDASDDAAARVWAPYGLPDLPRWHSRRCVLIGDAAHGLPPNGQGSGVAFADAAILARLLAANPNADVEAVFARFEAVRRPRIAELRSDKAPKLMKAKSGPWVWWAKKWAFRSMFWFKSGTLHMHKDGPHEVDQVDYAM